MSTWDAARLASRRQLPTPRKMMGPVGGASWHPDNASVVARDPARMTACDGCGHHVCSCEPDDPPSLTVNGVEMTEAEFNRLLQLDVDRIEGEDRIAPTSGRLLSASPIDTHGGCRSDAPEPHNPCDYRFPVLVHRVVTDDGDAVEFYR